MDATTNTAGEQPGAHTAGLLEVEDERSDIHGHKRFSLYERSQLVCEVPNTGDVDYERRSADRLAACWNACDGLTTEQVASLGPGGVAELVAALRLVVGCASDRMPDSLGGNTLPGNRTKEGRVCTWLVDGAWIDQATALLARMGYPDRPQIY